MGEGTEEKGRADNWYTIYMYMYMSVRVQCMCGKGKSYLQMNRKDERALVRVAVRAIGIRVA